MLFACLYTVLIGFGSVQLYSTFLISTIFGTHCIRGRIRCLLLWLGLSCLAWIGLDRSPFLIPSFAFWLALLRFRRASVLGRRGAYI